ncbi:MAG: hypothetical protein RRA60_01295 [Chlorobiota bacterium]|nr:hypothetical protein [Chlorobiota bacterium]
MQHRRCQSGIAGAQESPPGAGQSPVRAWAAGQYTVVLRTEAGSTAVPLVVVR